MSADKIVVEVPASLIAAHFLGLGGTFCNFPWERGSGHEREWWLVEIHQHHRGDGGRRESLDFILKCNGIERAHSEIPIAALFDWLPRLLAAAEKTTPAP